MTLECGVYLVLGVLAVSVSVVRWLDLEGRRDLLSIYVPLACPVAPPKITQSRGPWTRDALPCHSPVTLSLSLPSTTMKHLTATEKEVRLVVLQFAENEK